MTQPRKSGMYVGALGLIFSALCFFAFWAFSPIVLAAMLFGLPAAGYAWLTGWRRLAQVGFVAALVPAAIIALESGGWPIAMIAVVLAAITGAVVWRIESRRAVRSAS